MGFFGFSKFSKPIQPKTVTEAETNQSSHTSKQNKPSYVLCCARVPGLRSDPQDTPLTSLVNPACAVCRQQPNVPLPPPPLSISLSLPLFNTLHTPLP